MKIGSTCSMFYCYGNDRYKMMKRFGFDGVDYHMEGELHGRTEEAYEQEILAEKALMDEAGIVPYQVHGPWRYPPHDETEELRAERADAMRRSIRCTALIGCKNWVIHPVMPFGALDEFDKEQFWQINLEFFRALLPTAKEYDVTICFENMPMSGLSISPPEKTLEFIHMIDDENFKFCLDTGHCSVLGISPAEAVRMAGDDLRAIHVHDNDGKSDAHWVLGTGVIDWKDFVAALREINYQGFFSLECKFVCRQLKTSFLPNVSNEVRVKTAKMIADEMLMNETMRKNNKQKAVLSENRYI
ncbi:MAG: sugar phosphate isomerase/epimerase [Clostridia bacterium]|nr:sugar phosphate isomerase/epimerase [Clostridia bacterium]